VSASQRRGPELVQRGDQEGLDARGRHGGQQEEGEEHEHGARQQHLPAYRRAAVLRLRLILQDAGLQQDGRHHRDAEQPHGQKGRPPADTQGLRHQPNGERRGHEAEIAREGMRGEGPAHTAAVDAAAEDCVIGRVDDGIAEARDHGERHDHPVVRREGHGRDRQRHEQRPAD
jgi:hypothetical protein